MKEQTKCYNCGIRFGEIDDEPIHCEECDVETCSQCEGCCACVDPEDNVEQ